MRVSVSGVENGGGVLVRWAKMWIDVLDPDSTVYGLGDTVFRLWVELILYSAREETHGRVVRMTDHYGTRRLEYATSANSGKHSGKLHAQKFKSCHVQELATAGLLYEQDGWFWIAGWEKWQKDLEAAIAGRDKDRERKQRERSGVDVQSDASRARASDHVRAPGEEKERELSLSLSFDDQGGSAESAGRSASQGSAAGDASDPRGASGRPTAGRAAPDLIPALQPADQHGLRPFVRDALLRYRNTRDPAFLREALREESITQAETAELYRHLPGDTSANGAG